MAPLDHPSYPTSYGYPSPDSFQSYAVESLRWGTALYDATPSIEPMGSDTWRGVHPSMPTVIGDATYVPPGIYTVQSTPFGGREDWSPPSPPETDLSLSPYSPFVPTNPNSSLQHIAHDGPSTSSNSPNYVWLPQRPYTLTAHHFVPMDPIEFNVDSGEPGIRLSAAFNRKFSELKNRDDLVFESNKSPTITMRLEWPGYASWGRQVRVLDSRSVQQSISREKLAYEVAKTVFRFAQPESGKRQTADSEGAPHQDRTWALDDGNIGLDDLVLVRVENVSKGSWQPQFLVSRRH